MHLDLPELLGWSDRSQDKYKIICEHVKDGDNEKITCLVF